MPTFCSSIKFVPDLLALAPKEGHRHVKAAAHLNDLLPLRWQQYGAESEWGINIGILVKNKNYNKIKYIKFIKKCLI